jgi:small subunit ribosomal protein S17
MSTAKKETVKKAPAKKAVAPKEAAAPKETNAIEVRTGLQKRKLAVGVVVSDKMQKTIVVKTDRRVRHGLYKKYLTRSQKFKAHDEKNEAKVGDLVSIIESRPLSRDKRWALQKIIRRAIQTADANV